MTRESLSLRPWYLSFMASAISLAFVGLGAPALGAPPPTHPAPKPAGVTTVTGVRAVPSHFSKAPAGPARFAATKTNWPTATSATVKLAADGKRVRAGAAPVWAQLAGTRKPASANAVRVQVLSHAAATAAGIPGVLLSVSADNAGPLRLGVDYSSFAQAYGGNWRTRPQPPSEAKARDRR